MFGALRPNPVVVLLCLVLALPAGARAADPPNIVVLGVAAGEDNLAADDWARQGVIDRLSERLLEAGYAVYGEAALASGEGPARAEDRSDRDLLGLARKMRRPPLDLAILLSLSADAREHTYTTKITSRIDARLFDVATGRRLGSFVISSPDALRAPIGCDRVCILAAVARDGRRLSDLLAREVGARLASVAAAAPAAQDDPLATAFSLVFDGFSTEEINELEEYLVVFSGYQRHRPVGTAEGRHEYWYESQTSRGRLSRNLRKMLGHLDLHGRVHLAGNVFTVEKLGTPGPAASGWGD